MNKWQNYVGEICTSRNGKKYIKVIKDFKVYEGQKIWLRNHLEYCDDLLSKSLITADVAEQKKSKNWISFILNIAPQDDPSDKNLLDRSQWGNEVLDIRENSDGSFYILAKKSFEVAKGEAIFLSKPVEDFEEMLEKGKITKEKFESMLNGIKMKDEDGNIIEDRFWLRFRGTLPPKK